MSNANFTNFTITITFNQKTQWWNLVVVKPDGLVVSGIKTNTADEAMNEAKKTIARSMAEKAQSDCW